jgi:hypothetical protein
MEWRAAKKIQQLKKEFAALRVGQFSQTLFMEIGPGRHPMPAFPQLVMEPAGLRIGKLENTGAYGETDNYDFSGEDFFMA